MGVLKVFIVIAFLVLGGYYIYHMDEINSHIEPTITKSTDYFIIKSDQIITVVDLWANGPKQTYATSGSENINFVSAEPVQPINVVENISSPDEIIIIIDDPEPTTLQLCEDNFKKCVDSAHNQYGVYILVKEVKIFNDNTAVEFYNSRKSTYQPEFNIAAVYPLILVHAEAEGLGGFVAICKDGEYPKDLNSGLPC